MDHRIYIQLLAIIMKIKIILISVLLVLNLWSCQDDQKTIKTGIDYSESGLPDIGMDWSREDLQKALTVLKAIKKTDTFSLPRLKDGKTSVVFKKIMNSLPTVNTSDTTNLLDQFGNLKEFNKTLPDLFVLYAGASEKENRFYSNEATEILKRVIQETTNGSDLFFNHYVNGEKESTDIAERTEKLNGGTFKIFNGSLNINDPSTKFHPQDKLSLAETISKNLKKVWEHLSNEQRTGLLKRVNYFSENSDSPEVRGVLTSLAQDLEKSK